MCVTMRDLAAASLEGGGGDGLDVDAIARCRWSWSGGCEWVYDCTSNRESSEPREQRYAHGSG